MAEGSATAGIYIFHSRVSCNTAVYIPMLAERYIWKCNCFIVSGTPSGANWRLVKRTQYTEGSDLW